MQNRDSLHLKVLGLSANPSKADIKRAYKEQLLLWHPDKVPNNLENYQEIVAEFTIIFRRIQAAFDALNGADINISHKEESEYNATLTRMTELRQYNFSIRALIEINSLRRTNEQLMKKIEVLEQKSQVPPSTKPSFTSRNTEYCDPLNFPSRSKYSAFSSSSFENRDRKPAESVKAKIFPEGLIVIIIEKDYYNFNINMTTPLASNIYLDFRNRQAAEKFQQEWNRVKQQQGMEFYFQFHETQDDSHCLRSYFKDGNQLCSWMANDGRANKMLAILNEYFDLSKVTQNTYEIIPGYLRVPPSKFRH